MKTKSFLLVGALALTMTLVSCNNKQKTHQNAPMQSQREQAGNRMRPQGKNFQCRPGTAQNREMNESLRGRKNQGRENFPMKMLTEKQKESFKTIRTNCMKEVQTLNDQFKELKLHEKTLMNADQPDINAINANIDKMSTLQNKIAKIYAKSEIEMSAQLTNEQKTNMKNRHGKQGHKGKVNNHNKNRSQCPSEK